MTPGIYKSGEAMGFRVRELDIVSNNISNISTDGFKKKRIAFQTILSSVTEQWDPYIQLAASTYNVDPDLIRSVLLTESGGDPYAISPKGAKGLMQLNDVTIRELGVMDPFDPEENIMAGTRYLRQLLDKYGDVELALAAYNAGPGNVDKYGGIPPFAETINYVNKVISTKMDEGRGKEIQGIIDYTDFSQGPLEETRSNLDFAIKGEGFFTVSTPYGEKYTRAGSFSLDNNGRLITHQGYPVLGEGGEIILSGENISVNELGEIYVDGKYIDKFLIKNFRELENFGENLFTAKGEEIEDFKFTILQGYVEKSNVLPTQELINLVELRRNYESCERILSAQDRTIELLIRDVGGL